MKRYLFFCLLPAIAAAQPITSASQIAPVELVSADPATCTAGQGRAIFNTTAKTLKICTDTNTWSAPGVGGVTSIATTGPITGGTITGTGTIACATCGVTGSPLSQFAATTSAQLAATLSDETGSGLAVFGTNPVFASYNTHTAIAAPGTPSAGNARCYVDSTSKLFSCKDDAGVVTAMGSGGTPGGSNTQLQYNNNGAFGGISGLTWNGTTITFGAVNVDATAATVSLSSTFVRKDTAFTMTGGQAITAVPDTNVPGLIISGGAIPGSMPAGGIGISTGGILYHSDGTFIQADVSVASANNTALPTAPTSGRAVTWGTGFTLTAASFDTANIVRKDATNAGTTAMTLDMSTSTSASAVKVPNMQWVNTVAQPTCDVSARGKVWYVAGGTSVKDTFALCGKDASDVYGWRTIY